MVKVDVKLDCGNAPKKLSLRDYHIALANHDLPKNVDRVADTIQWEQVGKRNTSGKADFERVLKESWDTKADVVTLDTIITHGNTASVNGTLIDAKGVSYGFCDVYTFTSSAQNAKIKTITSYLIKCGRRRFGHNSYAVNQK